jgi:DNA repair protein RadC
MANKSYNLISSSEISISYTSPKSVVVINNSQDAFAILKHIWHKERIHMQEFVYALYLNHSNGLIGWCLLSMGTRTGAMLDCNIAAATALKCLATKVILAHNHPTGNILPSLQDLQISEELLKVLDTIGVKLEDHLIINNTKYFSMQDEGLFETISQKANIKSGMIPRKYSDTNLHSNYVAQCAVKGVKDYTLGYYIAFFDGDNYFYDLKRISHGHQLKAAALRYVKSLLKAYKTKTAFLIKVCDEDAVELSKQEIKIYRRLFAPYKQFKDVLATGRNYLSNEELWRDGFRKNMPNL